MPYRKSPSRPVSSNHCPDEKGTERLSVYIEDAECSGSNHCPDEKGTESTGAVCREMAVAMVATIAPMKRGLKATTIYHHSTATGM